MNSADLARSYASRILSSDDRHVRTTERALADRYTIERELGAGGMATVYLARDLKNDGQVAIQAL